MASFLFTSQASAQSKTSTASDTVTPLATSPGAPSGSYELSGFENVNLYNGSLNFHLPLVRIGGRGSAGYTMTLSLDSKGWILRHSQNQLSETWLPTPNGWAPKPGLSAGIMTGRRSGFDPKNTYYCQSHISLYETTLTTLTFIGPDGTEYDFRDQLNGGARMPVTDVCPAFPYTAARRGRVWVAADGSAATFISDTDIYDKSDIPSTPRIVHQRPMLT
jgi:hypothetical protein